MQIAILLLIIGLVGAVAYLFVARPDGVVEAAVEEKKAKYIDEGDTEELAKAKAALDEATAALNQARQAERTQLVPEQTEIVKDLERRLKELEVAAILQPTDPALIKETAEVEAIAHDERVELEARWKGALFEAHTAMNRAKVAVDIANEAHDEAKAKVAYWQNQVAVYKNAVMQAQRMLSILTIEDLRRDWETKLALYRGFLEKSEKNVVVARNDATAVRVEVIAAISKADDAVEAVLRIIADLRLLGILLLLADRVDAIARATRMKLGELETKLRGE